ncbi:MAG: peptide ABC transporter substrate-binding protein, partial [Oceanipulchritudo sp.]
MKFRIRKGIRVPLLLLAASLVAVGCARERPAEAAAREGVLLLGNGPEPEALDPHVTTGTAALSIQTALYEGLVAPHPETLEPVPAVAESWNISSDGLRYRFRIREAARWSDGRPVVAADFMAAWERALRPEQGTPYAYMLHGVSGAAAYNRAGEGPFSEVGFRVIGERELEIVLEEPIPYFLSLLMHPVWYPVPAHRLAGGDDGSRSGGWTTVEGFAGNGPFVLVEWKPNQYVATARNPHYWDAARVDLEGIRFHAFDEPAAEERAFLAGQLHVTDSLPPSRVQAYREKESPFLRIDPYLGTYYILPNLRGGVLGDRLIRKALSLSIDRPALVENLLGAGQEPARGFVPAQMPGYDSPEFPGHDPGRARKLLAEAGYPGGEGFPRLEYLFNSSESHRKIAEALQAMWREELGIEVSLLNQEWRTYLQRRASGDFELARAVWIGDYVEPSTFLGLWTSESGNNWAGWRNPRYDALMEAARSASRTEARMGFYRK